MRHFSTFSATPVRSSNCIICNASILVDEPDINDMDKHVCSACAGTNQVRSVDYAWGWGYVPPAKKCECGAKAGGFQYHARWCPVFEEPMKSKETT